MNVFEKVLDVLKIRRTRAFSKQLYKRHPDKNNFLGLTDIFKTYQVDTICFKAPASTEISEFPLPLIAQYGTAFCVVLSVNEDDVTVFYDGKTRLIANILFHKIWSGNTLCITNINNASEPEYKSNFFKQIVIDLLLGSSLVFLVVNIILSIASHFSPEIIALFGLNLAGLYLSFLSMKKDSATKNKLCTMISDGNCDAVLNSSAAKLFGLFSLGQIGLSYFISNLVILAFFSSFLSLLALINCVAMIMPVWSLVYQKIIAKSWCPVCLLIQIAVVLTFLVQVVFSNLRIQDLAWLSAFHTSSIFLFTFLVVYVVVRLFNDAKRYDNSQSELLWYKSDLKIFQQMLSDQVRYDTLNASSLRSDYENKAHELTIVMNPFCGPCKLLHSKIESLFTKYISNKYALRFVFTAFSEEREKIIIAFIGYYYEYGFEKTYDLITNWFEKEDIKEMHGYYHRYKNEQRVIEELERQKMWLDTNKIMATPKVLFDGYALPPDYDIIDIKYIRI